MDKDNRTSPRIAVSIKMACEAAEGGSLHVQDLSDGGFQARGRIGLGVGDPIMGTIHVFPLTGDLDVAIRGTVVRVVTDGADSVLGVKIQSFGEPEGEKAYREFARELCEDD
jgi:hypothetical protein